MPDWSTLAPTTEAAWSEFSETDLAAIAPIDQRELEAQRQRVSEAVAAKITEPTYSVRNRARNWERLISKMESGWPPDGTYFPEEYINDLLVRDNLDEITHELPEATRGKLRHLLDTLDTRFEHATVPDDGTAIRPWISPRVDYDQLNWRWHRRPTNTPWTNGAEVSPGSAN